MYTCLLKRLTPFNLRRRKKKVLYLTPSISLPTNVFYLFKQNSCLIILPPCFSHWISSYSSSTFSCFVRISGKQSNTKQIFFCTYRLLCSARINACATLLLRTYTLSVQLESLARICIKNVK